MNFDDAVRLIRTRFRVLLTCPNCKEITRPYIDLVKLRCHKCNGEFEQNLSDLDGYYPLSLYIPKGIILDKFRTQDEVKIQYNDFNKSRAEDIIKCFQDSIGAERGEEQIRKVKDIKTNKTININEITLSKSEYMKYYLKKK